MFIGCNNNYEESKLVLFSAPFDGTTSYRPGTRFAGAAIRNESYSIETYSPYLDKDLEDICVFDAGELELCFGNTEKVLEDIEKYVDKIVKDKKIPCMIGGEHLVTLGAVKAVKKQFENLHIIQFDAHADLRNEYLGEKLSHASVMRRCHDIVGDNKIFQFGIRSGEKEEFLFAKNHTIMHKFNVSGVKSVISELHNKPIYLTVDLDVLDPSNFCGTGTPEAGGVSFTELLETLMEIILKLNVVGFDMTELSPTYDQSGASTSLACKLLREVLLAIN